jgi:ribosome-binding factor A
MLRDRDGAGLKKPASPRSRIGAPTQRQLRVAEEIRHVLSTILTREQFRDPDLADAKLTVTEVRISPDMKNATAFVARLGRSDVDKLLPGLKRAAPYLRSRMAPMLKMRAIPALSFQPDTALEYAMKIEALMHQPKVARDLAPPVIVDKAP